jgi:hypothetical protein
LTTVDIRALAAFEHLALRHDLPFDLRELSGATPEHLASVLPDPGPALTSCSSSS